ncbi:MAG: hypothetical protein KF690_05205 [Bacteroidetes bacterium]|nr:hypothetical protein [Bacteroidota bacterium]
MPLYHAGTNRLSHLNDTVADTLYAKDVDDQDTLNYAYDRSGNLIRDLSEGISHIEWTLQGKVAAVHKTDNSRIEYLYDPMGQRTAKRTLVLACEGDTVSLRTTWYARDAQGNVLSVYTQKTDTLRQQECHMYGSSRLGIQYVNRLYDPARVQLNDTDAVSALGQKHYEFANHLGNVLATVTDRKLGVDTNTVADNVIDVYIADMVSATDYYPFGMTLPGRHWQRADSMGVQKDTCLTCQYLQDLLHGYGGSLVDSTSLETYLDGAQNLGNFTPGEYMTSLRNCGFLAPVRRYGNNGDHEFADNAAHDVGTRDFTLSLWVRPSTIVARAIVGKVVTASGRETGYKLYMNHSGTGSRSLSFVVGDGASGTGTAHIYVNGVMRLDHWVHVSCVRVGNNPNNWRIYINGKLRSHTVLANDLATGNADNAIGLKLGSQRGGAANDYFVGRLTNLRMHLKALSASQIDSLYCGCSGMPSDSLVYYMPMNETGGTPQDILNSLSSSASGSNQSIVNELLPDRCSAGINVRSYNGSGDHIFADTSAHDVGTRNFSLSFWMRPGNFSAMDMGVLNKLSLGPSRIKGYQVSYNSPSDGLLGFMLYDSTTVSTGSAGVRTTFEAADTARWHHVVCVRVGNNPNNWQIYVDGQPKQLTLTTNGLSTGDASNAGGLRIGSRRPASPFNYHTGHLGQVRMYHKALSANEVDQLLRGCPEGIDSLLYYIPMDEGSGTPVDVVNGITSTAGGSGQGVTTGRVPGDCSNACTGLCVTLTKKVPVGYRYAFNGKEDDIETGWQDYGMRMYDKKTHQFTSVDPLISSFPQYSSYQFAGLNPIWNADLDGLEPDPRAQYREKVAQLSNNVTGLRNEKQEKLNISIGHAGTPYDNPMRQLNSQWSTQSPANNNVPNTNKSLLTTTADLNTSLGISLGIGENSLANPTISSNAIKNFTVGDVSSAFKAIGRVSYIGGLGFDGLRLASGEIGVTEFSYNSVAATLAAFGGPAGFVVGSALLLKGYDTGPNSLGRTGSGFMDAVSTSTPEPIVTPEIPPVVAPTPTEPEHRFEPAD